MNGIRNKYTWILVACVELGSATHMYYNMHTQWGYLPALVYFSFNLAALRFHPQMSSA